MTDAVKQSLNIFNRIVSDLLADEDKHPVAEFVPSDTLGERLDLKLQHFRRSAFCDAQ